MDLVCPLLFDPLFAGYHCRPYCVSEMVRSCRIDCLCRAILLMCTLISRGHNELDEPAFTQPRMYEKIRSRKSVPQLYEDKLIVRHRLIFERISDQRLTRGYCRVMMS
jgi:hypothetical protein